MPFDLSNPSFSPPNQRPTLLSLLIFRPHRCLGMSVKSQSDRCTGRPLSHHWMKVSYNSHCGSILHTTDFSQCFFFSLLLSEEIDVVAFWPVLTVVPDNDEQMACFCIKNSPTFETTEDRKTFILGHFVHFRL